MVRALGGKNQLDRIATAACVIMLKVGKKEEGENDK